LVSIPFTLFCALKECRNVVMLPAQNGLRVIAPLLVFENMLFHRRLHYIVIGGWLPEFLRSRPILAATLKCFDAIYVETSTMKRALDGQGFKNVEVMPNCKELKILNSSELIYTEQEPYALCTFSRVMKEKGIGDAVSAVRSVNEYYGRTVYTLDIYGQVDSEQKEWFAKLKKTFPEYVQYCGPVAYNKSVETLKKYYALLFPTRFFTEGIPGTIVDAYAAGIPVICSKWESFVDLVEEDATGLGYMFAQGEHLKTLMRNIAETPAVLNRMKPACIKKAEQYMPETAMAGLVQNMKER